MRQDRSPIILEPRTDFRTVIQPQYDEQLHAAVDRFTGETIVILGLYGRQNTTITPYSVELTPRPYTGSRRVLIAEVSDGSRETTITVVISGDDGFPWIGPDGLVNADNNRIRSLYTTYFGQTLSNLSLCQPYQVDRESIYLMDQWHRLPDLFSDDQGNRPPIEQLPPQTILFMQRHIRKHDLNTKLSRLGLRDAAELHGFLKKVNVNDGYFGLLPVLYTNGEVLLLTTSYHEGQPPLYSLIRPIEAQNFALRQGQKRKNQYLSELSGYRILAEKYGFRTNQDN